MGNILFLWIVSQKIEMQISYKRENTCMSELIFLIKGKKLVYVLIHQFLIDMERYVLEIEFISKII